MEEKKKKWGRILKNLFLSLFHLLLFVSLNVSSAFFYYFFTLTLQSPTPALKFNFPSLSNRGSCACASVILSLPLRLGY